MEEENQEAMDLKCPRKLDFNAPLLSTRRPGYSIVAGTSCSSNFQGTAQNTSERIPFSWEQAPGKPKDVERGDSIHDEPTPRPRQPPCLWHLPKQPAETNLDDDDDPEHHDQDDNCDGDVDDDDDYVGDKSDVFSDAMDVFSLSEALDIVQNSEKAQSDKNDGLRLKLAESRGNQSPSYMIKRFLPDATALAESSALHFSKRIDKTVCDSCSCPDPEAYLAGAARQSYAVSLKGCGLENLIPWRMKHKLCAIKSPVMPCAANLQKHRRSSK